MTDTCNEEHSIGLETRNIFLDTEVFRSNGHNLNTKIMKLLGRYVADGVFVLHITDITLREVSRQIDTMEAELKNRVNRVVNDLRRWNNRYRFAHHHLPIPEPFSEPAQPSDAFGDFEWILRHDWNAYVHSAAGIPIESVLAQYFSRQAPFDKEGSKEFPDAVTLITLQNWCARAQQSVYVVSKDEAVRRAADERDHLIAVDSLEQLFARVTAAQDHDMADAIYEAFDEPSLHDKLQDALSESIDGIGVIYDGDKYDAEINAMEIVELNEVDDITVLGVDQDYVSCVVQVKLLVSAEIYYEDISCAMWDNEDGRYYGAESITTEIQDSVTAKIFVELERDGEDVKLSSTQFITRDVTITDYFDDGYPYK